MKTCFVVALALLSSETSAIKEIDGLYPTQTWVPGPRRTQWDGDQISAENSQKS